MSDDNRPKKRKGLKIGNETSSVPAPKQDNTAAFETKAKAAFEKIEDFKSRSYELGSRFRALVEDKTLGINKTQIQKELEAEVLSKLVLLSHDINNDEVQVEGAGSTALCQLIMKMMLVQRDVINNLAYSVEKLAKQLAETKQQQSITHD
jgi:hypothetical protein